MDDRQSPGIPRRDCYRKTAGTGSAAARTLRRHQWLRARWQACRRATGSRPGSAERSKLCRAPWFRPRVKFPSVDRPIVYFDGVRHAGPLSVRQAFAGKHVMLIGVTGFIGKVWLVNTLMELPEIGRIYLLIRRQKSNPAMRRFEKLVEESPVFDPLYERYGAELARFLRERVEVVEGDVCQPGLGLAPEVSAVVAKESRPHHQQFRADRFQSRSARCVGHQRRRGDERHGICAPVGPRRASASFHLLRGGRARRPRGRDDAPELHSGGSCRLRCGKGMALRCMPSSKQAEQLAESAEGDRRAPPAGSKQRARCQRSGRARRWRIRSARIASAGCANI